MNDYWHIPRASLSSSSASSAVSSASSTQRSNRARNKQKPEITSTHYKQQQHQRTSTTNTRQSGERRDSEMSVTTSAAVTAAAAAAVLAAAKRKSSSSQGSNDSNSSTRSAASGSLLLTAANLERMAEIHKTEDQQHHKPKQQQHVHQLTYNANLIQVPSVYEIMTRPSPTNVRGEVHHHPDHYQQVKRHQDQTQNDAVIIIDPNLNFIKTKELDTVSIASSMHFTMINGELGANKKPKKGLCDRGRQVTVLIVTMSTIFLLLIICMVYALEMRAREMPQS